MHLSVYLGVTSGAPSFSGLEPSTNSSAPLRGGSSAGDTVTNGGVRCVPSAAGSDYLWHDGHRAEDAIERGLARLLPPLLHRTLFVE